MKTLIVDGHALAQLLYQKMRRDVALLRRQGVTPKLGVVVVGQNSVAQTYIRKKEEAARIVGVSFMLIRLSARSTKNHIIKKLHAIQQQRYGLSGLIVQLPLPRRAMTDAILDALQPEKDVDCLSATNRGRLMHGYAPFVPPTPWAMLHILERHKIALKGKYIVVMGAGRLVGRPLVNMLMQEGATVSVVNHKTKNITAFTKHADIIMTGVGKPHLLTGAMIRRGAVVIDAGTSFIGKKMVGDVDMDSVVHKASLVTPTPGGVGPLTVAKLIGNTIDSARYDFFAQKK